MRYLFVAINIMVISLTAWGVGGCGAASDNPPDVEGSYSCISGCDDICTFSDSATVTQTGSSIVVVSDFDTCTGDVNNNGDGSLDCENGSCDVSFAGGTAALDCSAEGTNCQRVTYARD